MIQIKVGDVREQLALLPDESVHCVVTSPPYWGLRCYGVEGQLGQEPKLAEHIAVMVDVFREVRRVMRKDATCWINYGSSYVSSNTNANQSRPFEHAQPYGNDGTRPAGSEGLGCAYPGQRDERQDGTLSRHGHKPDTDPLGQQLQQHGGAIDRDILHLGSLPEVPGCASPGVLASTTDASLRHVQDVSARKDALSVSPQNDLTSPCDVDQSAYTDGRTHGKPSLEQILAARNWDKESLALACLYLSIASREWKAKDLANTPNLLAEALQCDGWYVRSEIIWSKPNPMPESVRDRPTSSHEKIWLLSKSPRYFYDADAVRTERASNEDENGFRGGSYVGGQPRPRQTVGNKRTEKQRGHSRRHAGFNDRWDAMSKAEQQAAGANLRNVWNIATMPFKDAHFATFPPNLAETCIKAGCPKGGTVLDPFGGSGTTGLVADRLGRDAILIELNPEYAEMARRRIADDAGMFASVGD